MGKSLQDQFSDWIYANYPVCNGDMLVNYLEDTDLQYDFLVEMGLPIETEL